MVTLDLSPRRLSRLRAVEERNLCWQEMDRERREWAEKLEVARRNGWPRPISGGLIKSKFEIASGLRGLEAGWDIDTVPIVDFGNVNLAGAGTIRSGFATYPTYNPVHAVGWMDSPDLEPFEQPSGTLTGASGARVAGSSVNPLAILGGCYVVHITSGAAVYAPAGSTLNWRVISTVTTVGGAFSTLATIATAGLGTNFVDTPAIAAPSERQVAAQGGAQVIGTLLATCAAIFNGDSLFGELVTTGALNVQGNILFMECEII